MIYNILITIIVIFSFGITSFFIFLDLNFASSRIIIEDSGSFEFRNVLYYFSLLIDSSGSWFRKYLLFINVVLFLTFFGLSFLATIYSRDYLVSMALFACSYFLAFSGVWEHHFTFILPFIVMLWIRDKSRLKWFIIFVLLALPTPLIFLDPQFGISPDPIVYWSLPEILLYKCSKAIPILIFFILLLNAALKSPRQKNFMISLQMVSQNIFISIKKQDPKKFPNTFISN